MRNIFALGLAALIATGAFVSKHTHAQEAAIEIFDAHLHYNWEPTPYYTLDEVLALFKKHRVTGILATSRPNIGTHALIGVTTAAELPELWVVPFIRPYRVRADITSWMGDPKIFDLIQEEYARGGYRGIGEFHLSGKAAANEWVKRTVDFAVEKGLYLHCHCDAEALEILYGHNARARIIWAHTGFSLEPERVGALLAKYPELWGELSYRSGITGAGGQLTAEWRGLFEKYPDRFLLGSDTWINERWASYGDTMANYRAWLAQLPRASAEKIAHGNARRLFGG
jgi:Amidohydrolase